MTGGWNPFHRPDGTLRAGWWVLLWQAASVTLPFLTLPLALLVLPRARLDAGGWEGVALLNVLLATALCLRIRQEGVPTVGLAWNRRWALEFGAGLLGGILLMGGAALALRSTGAFHWSRVPGSAAGPLLAGFGLYTLVAALEELIYRGFAFQRLLEGLGPWPALLLGGAWFAWDHRSNPGMEDPMQRAWALANIALAGLFLGLAYLRTRSLALPMGLHLGWNWMQGSVLGFAVSGTTDFMGPWRVVVDPARAPWFHGGTFGLEASVFGTGACLVAVVGLLAWRGSPSGGPSTGGAR